MSKQSTPCGHGKRNSGSDESDIKPTKATKFLSDEKTISRSLDDNPAKDADKSDKPGKAPTTLNDEYKTTISSDTKTTKESGKIFHRLLYYWTWM